MAQVNKYTGSFRKKDGSARAMNFLRISELPDDVKTKIGLSLNDTPTQQTFLESGFEIVYDLDVRGFRTFNWNTITGQVQQQQMEF